MFKDHKSHTLERPAMENIVVGGGKLPSFKVNLTNSTEAIISNKLSTVTIRVKLGWLSEAFLDSTVQVEAASGHPRQTVSIDVQLLMGQPVACNHVVPSARPVLILISSLNILENKRRGCLECRSDNRHIEP